MHTAIFHEDCEGYFEHLGNVHGELGVVFVDEKYLVIWSNILFQPRDYMFNLADDVVFQRPAFFFKNFELPLVDI